jgi:hypothetical protein
MIYSLGFSLEKVAAMQEHGIRGKVFHVLPVRRLLNGSISLLHGYLGASRLYVASRSADHRLERVRLGIQYVPCDRYSEATF